MMSCVYALCFGQGADSSIGNGAEPVSIRNCSGVEGCASKAVRDGEREDAQPQDYSCDVWLGTREGQSGDHYTAHSPRPKG